MTPVRANVFAVIERELAYAYAKHGAAPWGRHEFSAVLREEFEELWDDVKSDARQENLIAEAIQVAACCIRYLETGDRYRGDHPVPATHRELALV